MARVLIAEDNKDLWRLFDRDLREMGHDPVLVASGLDAWSLLDQGTKFDCLITDYKMPLMDGLELVSRVRSDARMLSLPCALMSGDMISKEGRMLQFVCDELKVVFVVKPVKRRLIMEELLGPSEPEADMSS